MFLIYGLTESVLFYPDYFLLLGCLVCHGVPSPKVWDEYLQYVNESRKQKLKYISFRDKTISWENYSLILKFNEGPTIKNSHKDDLCMQFF